MLADDAQQWFNKRPEGAAALARRIDEMQTGCRTLIAAQHQPLGPKDRSWLVEKCQNWLHKFDDARDALAAGRDPAAIREEMDTAVRNIVQQLRQRAEMAAG